ncbi:hypothetical protein [Bradyrhizobium sp. RD5-C2]|uniref:hypothetical protein n=1 Tax=Bradyrhizobium sp. RD5-C2 TaxID=244562 RepID=UPI001CC4A197|nr:hypothetical protein [Bradyrhizobium sp. RD5-C2]GIQ77094.1 hypothetical protein BraRD5C2_55420 [Bradyrhizobium sp. RD5-C2]
MSKKHPVDNSPPEKWFTILGLIIVRRTDLLAATAFVISLSTLSYQLWQFAKGSNPIIYPPDTLYVFFDRYPNGVTATRIAGQLSFTNSGEAGHNAVLQDVSATIKLGERTIEEYWLSFGTVTRRDTEFTLEVKEAAHPFVVDGGGAVSHMVTFSPRVRDCVPQVSTTVTCQQGADFVTDIDFLKLLAPQKTLNVTFTGRVLGSSRTLKGNCSTSITDDFMQTLAKNDWYAARCVAAP